MTYRRIWPLSLALAQGLANSSAKRSLLPRRSPAAIGESFQSRESEGLRRKLSPPFSTNPILRTSERTAVSSMRCSVCTSATPVPGRALRSMTAYLPPVFKGREDGTVHLLTVDAHPDGVVVHEVDDDQIEVPRLRRDGSASSRSMCTMFFAAGVDNRFAQPTIVP